MVRLAHVRVHRPLEKSVGEEDALVLVPNELASIKASQRDVKIKTNSIIAHHDLWRKILSPAILLEPFEFSFGILELPLNINHLQLPSHHRIFKLL
jgi:hypothetical protein